MLPIANRKSYKRYFRDETAKIPLQTHRRRAKRVRQRINERQRVEHSSESSSSEDNEVGHHRSQETLLPTPAHDSSGHNIAGQPITDSDVSQSPPTSPHRNSSGHKIAGQPITDSDVSQSQPTSPQQLSRPSQTPSSPSLDSSTGDSANSGSTSDSDSRLSDVPSDYDNDNSERFSSDSDEEEDDIFWNRPLYENSQVTIGQAVIDVLDLYIRHNLSKVCLDDILKLINKLLPVPHVFPGTKYKLIKLLSERDTFSLVKHRYCSGCTLYLGRYDETLQLQNCTNCESSKIDGMFVELPIADTLKNLMESRCLYRYLTQKTEGTDDISDIKDGDLSESHQISQYPINLIWNTDGVPVFHSSNAQIWPVLFTISNLPPEIRKQNISLAGLWFGHSKPVMNTFLRPFVDSLRSLHNTGLTWQHPELHRNVTSHVAAPLITVDAKARSDMQGLISCNGHYGCSFCEHEGEVVRTERSSVLVYPVVQPSPQLRDKHRMMQQAQVAVETGKSQVGVVGPSCVSLIPSVDTGKSFVPDYMHAVALGVVRQFFWLWLDSKYHREPWYIGTQKDDIDNILLHIKPPNDMCRVPRSVSQGKHWKASEFRNWLLLYSPVCLVNILPAVYFQHWLLLVASIYMLLQDKIARHEIQLCEHLLQLFCEEAEDLYGKRHMSFNVHQLLHLSSSVKNWGPLWATSCFMFENTNGMLLSLIHGTQKVAEQIVTSTKFVKSLQLLKYEVEIGQEFNEAIEVLGGVYTGQIARPLQDALRQYSDLHRNDLESPTPRIYIRAKVRKLGTFTSQLYTGEKIRKSCVIRFRNEHSVDYGIIQMFAKYGNHHVVAFVNALKENKRNPQFVHRATGYRLKHFVSIEETNTVHVVLCSHILGKVVHFDTFVGIPPNEIEKNL